MNIIMDKNDNTDNTDNTNNTNKLTINDYFEMYINNKVKYDRMEHMKNIGLLDVKVIDNTIIKKIFVYIDSVLFNGTMMQYIVNNSINFIIRKNKTVSKVSTVGAFFVENNPQYDLHNESNKNNKNNKNNENNKNDENKIKHKAMGFAITYSFFQNILDNKIINVDLGVIDDKNKPYLSTIPIEPLMTTMEHEIIHMLMYLTEGNKLNDNRTVKSGHTKIFKILIYNIFGHYRVTSSFFIGDIKKNIVSKNNIDIGDIVKNDVTDVIGYVVAKKKQHVIICIIEDTGEYEYKIFLYKDVYKIDNNNKDKIDVIGLLDRLRPGKKIRVNSMTFIILKVNQSTISAKNVNTNKKWKIPKLRIFEITFLD